MDVRCHLAGLMRDQHERHKQCRLTQKGQDQIDLTCAYRAPLPIMDDQSIGAQAHQRKAGIKARQIQTDDEPQITGQGQHHEQMKSIHACFAFEGPVGMDECDQPQKGRKSQDDPPWSIQT